MIAALFVEKGGVYYGLDGVDPWDEQRDARKFDGSIPGVYHPPCSTWCQLARVNETRYGHKVGDDGGCFESALRNVRRGGGVLEHPAESIAWSTFGLQRPVKGGWVRSHRDPGWVCEVSQRAYGHRARKRTWLYYVGDQLPPELNWSQPDPEAWVSFMVNHGTTQLPRLSKREAKRTPLAFRDLLLSLARSSIRRSEAA